MELFIKTAYATATLTPITQDVTLASLFGKIVSVVVLPVISGVALGFAIYAGILFVTSGGDPEKVTKARNALLWALVGVIVVSLSYGIVVLLNKLFLQPLQ
jgi:hypothetical protein